MYSVTENIIAHYKPEVKSFNFKSLACGFFARIFGLLTTPTKPADRVITSVTSAGFVSYLVSLNRFNYATAARQHSRRLSFLQGGSNV